MPMPINRTAYPILNMKVNYLLRQASVAAIYMLLKFVFLRFRHAKIASCAFPFVAVRQTKDLLVNA